MTGTPLPEGLDGRDLSPALDEAATLADHPVYSDNLVPRWGAGTEYRMIRWRGYKYVRFRACEPLFFDLVNDPGEQHNLVVAATGEAREALAYLEQLAQESIDFEAAEAERLESEARLSATYPPAEARSFGNQYLLTSGQLVEADDTLYDPMVVTEHPETFFADWPAKEK